MREFLANLGAFYLALLLVAVTMVVLSHWIERRDRERQWQEREAREQAYITARIAAVEHHPMSGSANALARGRDPSRSASLRPKPRANNISSYGGGRNAR